MNSFLRITFALASLALLALTAVRALHQPALPDLLVPARDHVTALLAANARAGGDAAIQGPLREQAAALARVHPLDPTPHVLAMLAESEAGNRSQANASALMALSLQPRTRAARMHIVNELLTAGQYEEALSQITLLARIDPANQAGYTDAILTIAGDPRAWPALIAVVRDDPPWKQVVLRELAQRPTDLGLLKALFQAWPERQDLLLKRMINDGAIDAAYLTFAAGLPNSVPLTAPFDPGFEGLAGSAPFNWSVNTQQASYEPGGGIGIAYIGNGRQRIVQQVLPLGAGDYELSFTMTGTAPPGTARFEWRASCVGQPHELLRESFTPGSAEAARPLRLAPLPDGCDFVRLDLLAVPSQYPQRARFHLKTVSMRRVDAGGP